MKSIADTTPLFCLPTRFCSRDAAFGKDGGYAQPNIVTEFAPKSQTCYNQVKSHLYYRGAAVFLNNCLLSLFIRTRAYWVLTS